MQQESQEPEVLVECGLGDKALPRNVVDMRVFLEALIESVVVIDACGLIVMVNAAAERLFGYSRQELLGCPMEILMPERFRERHARHIAVFFQAPQPRPMGAGLELVGLRKDGVEFPIEVSLSYLDLEGMPLAPAFIVDLTARVEMEAVRQQLTEALQIRNQDLEAYAHTVAHDLKGPLGLMLGYAELLNDAVGSLDEETVHLATTQIVRSSKRMVRIIHELLLLATLRREELVLEPLDMARIVGDVQERLSWMQQECEGEIIIADVWPVALGYSAWVEEVWVNYVGNALKYGGCPPRIELGATLLNNGFIKFWVQDNGAGLTLEQQAALFKPFTRLDQVRATGNGLGLSIVANIITKMGGEVAVESEPGKGSVFSFTLPAFF